MHFLQFKKQYQISLLPKAFSNITLGDLMFVHSPYQRPVSVIENIPSHIYNLFIYQAVISRRKWRKRINEFQEAALTKTDLLSQRIIASPSLIKSIKNDFLELILLNFQEDTTVVEVAFSRLEQKEMSKQSKQHIRRLILRSPKEDGAVYKQRILTVNLANRLYYANLCFITNEENALEINRLLLHYPTQPLYRFIEAGRYVFEFSFKENPFCMTLEPLIDFGAGKA